MIKRRLTHIERIIANEIRYNDYTTLERLRTVTMLNDRSIKQYIENLRTIHGVPILSMRQKGYFIPKTDAEREHGLLVYEKQIETEMKTVNAIKQADLENWHEILEEEYEYC